MYSINSLKYGSSGYGASSALGNLRIRNVALNLRNYLQYSTHENGCCMRGMVMEELESYLHV